MSNPCAQVLALKELSIRGDIRTTTEYLVDLLESSEYASNTFNTRYAHSATDRLGCEAVHSLSLVVVLSNCVLRCPRLLEALGFCCPTLAPLAGWMIAFARKSHPVASPTVCWSPWGAAPTAG